MKLAICAAVAGLSLLGVPRPLSAQSDRMGGMFLAARAGVNVVGNAYRFRDERPVIGAGASLGAFLSPTWAVEFETWVRASNPECCPESGREALFSLSVVRQYARTGIQPYLLGGLTLLRKGSSQMQVQLGAGVQFPLFGPTALALDLRGNGGGAAMIVRPTLAAIYRFH
jgi:hypothetical protein